MIKFPRALLRERAHSWNLVGVAATPGVNAKSVAAIIRSDGGGFWSCSMTDVQLSGIKGSGLRDRQRQRVATLLWRAVRQLADGGVNALVVPRNDALFIPFPTVGAIGSGVSRSALTVPHSDDTTFSDGTEYYTSAIAISCAGGAALRATTMTIDLVNAGALLGGESFSIMHGAMGWRLYEIAQVNMGEDGTTATIRFNPPLREAIADGTALEFERPCCTMRLATTDAMDLAVAPWTFNAASVDFVEAFP